MSDLFEEAGLEDNIPRPLADRLRPQQIEDIIGQEHLTAPDKPIGKMLAQKKIMSMILWGPPGCGKTTMARILARDSGLHYEQLSAIFSGVGELRKVFNVAKQRRKAGQQTLLFVDEIHRFNKAQQDAFLPVVEDGTIILIGATTENPSFELNAALLSRCQVYILKRLDETALETLLSHAEEEIGKLPLTDEARTLLLMLADGDGRYLLTLTENVSRETYGEQKLNQEKLLELVSRRAPLYDKSDEGHYNLISALHKSVRGSDPDAALYWLCRMLVGGEDPLFLARRLTRMASEDIGLADPQALPLCLAAWDTYERLGSPEGELALAEAIVYLATSPKSNAVYKAYNTAMQSARATGSLMPPAHILNAPTKLMKDIGYGKDYAYDHNAEHAFSGQNYFPNDMEREKYYDPPERGFEREINKRLEYWEKLRTKKNAA